MTIGVRPRVRPRRTGLHAEIVYALGHRIVTGGLAPGDLLPSAVELSVGNEVSRTVIREAIKVLTEKGLVESRPKIGTRVLPRSCWKLIDSDVLDWSLESDDEERLYRELYEVRLIIEPHVAALAAVRRSDHEAQRLDELITTMGASMADVAAFVSADLDLHATILSSARNELLGQLTGVIRVALNAGQRLTARVPGGNERALQEHRAVVEAIKLRDPDAATDAMERLIRNAAQDLQHILHPDWTALELGGRYGGG